MRLWRSVPNQSTVVNGSGGRVGEELRERPPGSRPPSALVQGLDQAANLGRKVGPEPVVAPYALVARLDEIRFTQPGHVMGNRRLTESDRVSEIADADRLCGVA